MKKIFPPKKKGAVAEQASKIRRGDVIYIDFGTHDSGIVGSEQEGVRPALVVQNNKGNTFSPTIIVVPITTADKVKKTQPTHVEFKKGMGGLAAHSFALCEQVRTVDKQRIVGRKKGFIPSYKMDEVDTALGVSVGIIPIPQKKELN